MALKLFTLGEWGSKFVNRLNTLTGTVNAIAEGSPAGTFTAGTGISISGLNAIGFSPPVGFVYTSVDSTSPATLFGGSWSAIGAGRVLVGIDSADTDFDTAEETGGAKTHTLTGTEMPAHTHTTTGFYSAGDTGSSNYSSGTPVLDRDTRATGSQGGGGAHNNVQPYFVVYMWKRTA